MDEPGFEDGRGDEVDFVEDEDKEFGACVGGDLAFDFSRSGSVRVAGVEDVENYVGGGEDGFEDFVKGVTG